MEQIWRIISDSERSLMTRQTDATVEQLIDQLDTNSGGPPCMLTNELGLTAVAAIRKLCGLLENSQKSVQYAAYAFLHTILADDDLNVKPVLAAFEENLENAALIETFRSRPRPIL